MSPSQDPLVATPLDDHGNPAVDIGQQQDPGRALADLGHPSDQPLARRGGIALAHPVARPGGDQDAAHEGAAIVGHDPRGDEGHRLLGRKLQQLPQGLVLGLQLAGDRLPLHEPFLLLAQRRVLLPEVQEFPCIVIGLANGGQGPARCRP